MATRNALRRAIATNLGALQPIAPTIVDSEDYLLYVLGSPDVVGYHVFYRDQFATVITDENVGSERRLTVDQPFSDGVANEDVELWTERWTPVQINSFINQAISEIHNLHYDFNTPIYRAITRLDREVELADDVAMVNGVFYRAMLRSKLVYLSEIWVSNNDGVDIVRDTEDYQQSPSFRFNDLVTLGGNPTVQSVDIQKMNLSGYDRFEGWFKSTDDVSVVVKLQNGNSVRGTADSLFSDRWGMDLRSSRSTLPAYVDGH